MNSYLVVLDKYKGLLKIQSNFIFKNIES
jgi:hypothetical protein